MFELWLLPLAFFSVCLAGALGLGCGALLIALMPALCRLPRCCRSTRSPSAPVTAVAPRSSGGRSICRWCRLLLTLLAQRVIGTIVWQQAQ